MCSLADAETGVDAEGLDMVGGGETYQVAARHDERGRDITGDVEAV
jgi:hypothetical protein